MKKYLITILVLTSCGQEQKPLIEMSEADSVIAISEKHSDSVSMVLELADKKTEERVNKIIQKVSDMKEEISDLKTEIKSVNMLKQKTITIRDTIYVTQKKNFWGKTKVSVDSTKNIDSTEN